MTEGKWNNTHDDGELKCKTVWWMGRPIGNHEFTFFQLQLNGGTARASLISMFWLYYTYTYIHLIFATYFFSRFQTLFSFEGRKEKNNTQMLNLTEQYECNLTCTYIFSKIKLVKIQIFSLLLPPSYPTHNKNSIKNVINREKKSM